MAGRIQIQAKLLLLLAFNGIVLINADFYCWNFDQSNSWTNTGATNWIWSGNSEPDLTNIPRFSATSEYVWLQDQDSPPSSGTIESNPANGVTIHQNDVVSIKIWRHPEFYDGNARPVLNFISKDGSYAKSIIWSYSTDSWDDVSITCGPMAAPCCESYPCTGHFSVNGTILARHELLAFDTIEINQGCSKITPAPPTTAPPTAAPTTAPPTAAPTTAPPTAAPTTAPPTAAPTTAPPTAAPTTAPPTAAPTTAPPTASPTTAPPTAAPTTAPPTAAPTTAPPTNASTTAPSTAAPTTAPPTTAPSTAAPTTGPTGTEAPSTTRIITAETDHPSTAASERSPTDIPLSTIPVVPDNWCCTFETKEVCNWSLRLSSNGWHWSKAKQPVFKVPEHGNYIFEEDETAEVYTARLKDVPNDAQFAIDYFFETISQDTIYNNMKFIFASDVGPKIILGTVYASQNEWKTAYLSSANGVCNYNPTCNGNFVVQSSNEPGNRQIAAVDNFSVNNACAYI